MKWGTFLLLIGLLGIGGCARGPLLPGVNLILITVDTLRADHLGCYGYPFGKTPNLDRLAREGVLFSDMFASVPLTLPSHTTFLTGLFPSRHGVHDNGAYRLAEDKTTIAEYLVEAGYRTAGFVSSFQLEKKYGLVQGFDEYDDKMPENFEIFDPRVKRGPKADVIRKTSNQRRADEITALTKEWLARGGSEPFFLWLHYFDPHEIYDPPPPYDRMFPSLAFPDSLYDGEITYLDHHIGELVRLLETHGMWDRTVVLMSADHGEGLGEHKEMYHDTFIYDSTLRIPFLMFGGGLPEEWRGLVTEPVRSIDVVPTFLEFAGVDPASDVQGTSLVPFIHGGENSDDWFTYCESHSPTHNLCTKLAGIRTKEWKYIEAPRPELYRVSEDPGETRNLIDRYTDKARVLREILAEQLPDEDLPRLEIDAETRAQLEAIGYVHRKEGERPAKGAGKDPKEINPCIDGLHLSMLHFTYGRYDSALVVLDRLTVTCPGQSRIYDNIGNLQIRFHRYEETIEEFTALVERYPHYGKGYFWVGMGYLRTSRPAEALAWYEKALSRDPSIQVAHYNMGVALGRLKRIDEAMAAWERAVRMNPNSRTGRLAREAYARLKEAIDKGEIQREIVVVPGDGKG